MRLHLFPAAACAMLWPSEALASTTLATGSAPDIPWVRIILSFLLCILLAVAAIFVLRAYNARGGRGLAAALTGGNRASDTRIEIVAMRRINAHADLCVVHFGGEELLLSVGRDGASIVARNALPEGAGENALEDMGS